MGTLGLESLPPEVIHHIASFLCQQDLEKLSETCYHFQHVLNDDAVWKRFLSEQDRLLDVQPQRVEPAFQLDINMCKNRQCLLRKKRLVENWRNGSFTAYSIDTKYSYASGVLRIPKGKGQIIYRDNFIFLGRFTDDVHSDAIEVWNVSEAPVLHCVLPMEDNNYDSFYIIGSSLAVVVCSRVDVYDISIEEKNIRLLYSYLIVENEVVWGRPAYHTNRHDFRCVGWSHYRVGNYLVSNKCDNEPDHFPVLHIWDIANACKVGDFVSPLNGFSIEVHSSENDNWFLVQSPQSGRLTYYFKFNIASLQFSDSIFEYNGMYSNHLIFYNDCIIMFKNADDPNAEGWFDSVCEVYDFKTNEKLKSRRFVNGRKNYLLRSTAVVDEQFVLLCEGGFHVVDALTLETKQYIPCEPHVRYLVHQVNLFGSVFVMARENKCTVHVWDIDEGTRAFCAREICSDGQIYVSETSSKLVTFGHLRMTVIHLW